jgi:ArsR family metal-binding transcriptional regulator
MIGEYELEVTRPPCHPGSERFSAKARLKDDIRQVLPYLNAIWKGAIYNHEGRVLTWRTGGRVIAVRPDEIAVSNVRDRDEAARMVEQLIRQIEELWERRGEIQPRYTRREPPKALDVYKLLPGGNCRACGQPTCLLFALKVTAGEADESQCVPLSDGSHEEQRKALLHMLELAE